MSLDKSFGVGCYAFFLKKTATKSFSDKEIFNEIRIALSSVSSINNIQVENEDSLTDEKYEIEDSGKDFSDLMLPEPFTGLEITFDVYLPHRLQQELASWTSIIKTNTENFKVKIQYGFNLPVTTVELVNPQSNNDPSVAVAIIREFLEREINEKQPERFVMFDCLGPSPFHVDFYISPNKNEAKDLIEIEEDVQPGYDSVTILYDAKYFISSDEVLEFLEYSLENEFGIFYESIIYKNGQMRDWSEIQSLLNDLTEIEQNRKFMKRIKTYFNRSSLIAEIYTKLIKFETASISKSQTIKSQLNDLYNKQDYTFFKKVIEREINDRQLIYPVEQMHRLLEFHESRRVKSLELTIAIIASIIGGVIGSLVTIGVQ